MSLVDLQGKEIQSVHEEDCMIGTDLLTRMVACRIYKDDEICKLKLHFGVTTYEVRIPLHEVTQENLAQQWTELLKNAFSNHEFGRNMPKVRSQ